MARAQIEITADSSQATREIEKVNLALKGIEKSSDLAGKALASIGTAAAAAAAALGFAAVKLDDLADSAAAIGIGVNQLKALQFAAAGAGVDAGALEAGFRKLSANLGEAFFNNSSNAAKALGMLGLNAKELMQMPLDQQMTLIAEKLNGIENPAIRAALSMDLLGKGGERLLQAFKDPGAIERFNERLKALGLAISEADLNAVDELDGKVRELRAVWDAFLQKTVAALAPYLIDIIDNINKAIEASGGFEAILEKILDIFVDIIQVVAILATVWIAGKLVGALKTVSDTIIDILLLFTPAGWIGRAAKIVKGIAALVGIGATALVANEAKNAVDTSIAEVERLRKSIRDTRAARQTPAGAPGGSSEKELEDAKTLAIQNSTKATLEKYSAETLSIGASKTKLEYDKLINELANAAKTDAAEIEKLLGKQVQQLVEKRIAAQIINDITKVEEEAQREIVALLEDDKTVRAQLVAIMKMEQEYGRALTDGERQQLETATARLEIAKRLTAELDKNKAALNKIRAEKGGLPELENIRQEYSQADKDLEAAIRLGNKKLTAVAAINLEEKRKIYDEELTLAVFNTSEKLKLDREYLKSMVRIDNLKAEMDERAKVRGIALGEYELNQIMALEEEKLRLTKQYEDRKLQMQVEGIQRRLEAEKTGMAAVLSEQERSVLQQVGAQERQKAIVQERITFEKKSEAEKAQWAIDQGAQMFTALGAHNKRAFEAAKAFNIANAIMNTYLAATKALATYPWPFGLIGAAAAVGMGLAQVAQIRAQTYSGRALGGPVMGGQSYIVGESGPELFTPSTTGSITRNGDLEGMGKQVNVNFTIVANDTTGFDQLLASRRGMITQIINDAVLEKGKRSIA